MAFGTPKEISAKQLAEGEKRFDDVVRELNCWSSDCTALATPNMTKAGHAAMEGNIADWQTAIKLDAACKGFSRDDSERYTRETAVEDIAKLVGAKIAANDYCASQRRP